MLFLDTYAMIELAKGSPDYDKYVGQDVMTTVVHLYELYHIMLRSHSKEVAHIIFKTFERYAIEIEEDHLLKGSEMKIKYKISYGDALAYGIAQIKGIKVLTGDNDFKDLEGVEFVK